MPTLCLIGLTVTVALGFLAHVIFLPSTDANAGSSVDTFADSTSTPAAAIANDTAVKAAGSIGETGNTSLDPHWQTSSRDSIAAPGQCLTSNTAQALGSTIARVFGAGIKRNALDSVRRRCVQLAIGLESEKHHIPYIHRTIGLMERIIHEPGKEIFLLKKILEDLEMELNGERLPLGQDPAATSGPRSVIRDVLSEAARHAGYGQGYFSKEKFLSYQVGALNHLLTSESVGEHILLQFDCDFFRLNVEATLTNELDEAVWLEDQHLFRQRLNNHSNTSGSESAESHNHNADIAVFVNRLERVGIDKQSCGPSTYAVGRFHAKNAIAKMKHIFLSGSCTNNGMPSYRDGDRETNVFDCRGFFQMRLRPDLFNTDKKTESFLFFSKETGRFKPLVEVRSVSLSGPLSGVVDHNHETKTLAPKNVNDFLGSNAEMNPEFQSPSKSVTVFGYGDWMLLDHDVVYALLMLDPEQTFFSAYRFTTTVTRSESELG